MTWPHGLLVLNYCRLSLIGRVMPSLLVGKGSEGFDPPLFASFGII